jgi:hypothetical protein
VLPTCAIAAKGWVSVVDCHAYVRFNVYIGWFADLALAIDFRAQLQAALGTHKTARLKEAVKAAAKVCEPFLRSMQIHPLNSCKAVISRFSSAVINGCGS